MSAIAGLVRFDGVKVARDDLMRSANALHQFGPDRSEVLVAGPVGLVHVLMRMTPEDRFDRQPWRGESGALMVADLRLDNRDEMLDRIKVTRLHATAWSDSRVLLTGWEKFGDNIWSMLRGPFAVAIWDPRSHALTLARDHLGLNTLMWYRNGRFFGFATMPNGLFAFREVPRELSEEKFADFLVLNHADHVTTIYRHVFRLAPAHSMRVQRDGLLQQRRYWSPEDVKSVKLSSDKAYADGLRQCLDVAVRRQMRSAHPIGSLLSGGLDSSSVSMLAARALAEKNQRLVAFTGVPRNGFNGAVPHGHYADETPLVDAIQKKAGNIDVRYIQNTGFDDLADLERFFIALEGPVRNPTNLGWVLAILRCAGKERRRVLLGGLYGNYTISWNGWSQVAGHFLRGKMLLTYRQLRLFYQRTSYSRWVTLRKLLVEPLTPVGMGNWADRRRRRGVVSPWQDHSALPPDFATAMGVDSRARSVGHDFLYRLRPDERIRGLTSVDYAGDWLAAEKAVTGVEVRDPTADIDVISYCLGVPPTQYLAEGVDRSLIRRAMWGLLPHIVLNNRLSGLQGADWFEKLEAQQANYARQVADLSKSPLARKFIDLDRLERAIKGLPRDGWHTAEAFQEYNLMLTRGLGAGRFLQWFESVN